jgi:hypothetical protein
MKAVIYHQLVIRTLAPAFVLSLSARAVPSENGAWHVNGLEMPARFHETFANQTTFILREGMNADDQPGPNELLVDSRFSSAFGVDHLGITLNDGAISGDETGSYSPGRCGRVYLNVPGENLAAYINTSKDVMVVSASDSDYQKPHVATRLPAAMKIADLAGVWHVLVTTLPEDLTEVYMNQTTSARREGNAQTTHPAPDERFEDAYFRQNPGMDRMSLAVDATGNISGDATGTATVNADQSVTLHITGLGDMRFSPNAACDVMTNVHTDGDASPNLVVAVKSPPALAVADMKGVWRAQALSFPSRLIRTYYNAQTQGIRTTWVSNDRAQVNEILVDIAFSERPALTNELINLDSMGQGTGSVTGRLTSSAGALVFTPDDGSPVTLRPNASGTFAIAEDGDADYFGLIALVRVADLPAASMNELIGLQCAMDSSGNAVTSWNEATSLVLSRSEDLVHWTPLPETSGASSHVDTMRASEAFYRIEQAPAGE